MRHAGRRLLLVAAVLAGVAAVVYAMMPGPVPVDLAPAARGPMRVTVDEDGKTRIKERYVVSAPVAGQLLRIELHPGDPVEAGKTVLALIEPGDPSLLDMRARAEAEARLRAAEAARKLALAKVDRAREAHELAKHQYDRARQLLDSRSISREEFDAAEHRERIAQEELKAAHLGVQIAAFEVELAQAALLHARGTNSGPARNERFEIRSPIQGTVLRVFQESAGVVQPGTRLLELGDRSDLEVEIDVLSQDAVKIPAGAKVLMHWGGDSPLLGRVRLVEPAGFLKISALGVEEQRVNVIVDMVDPPEKRRTLGDAFRVDARIVLWEGDNVLKVPAGALFRQGDGWALFVAAGGRARLRAVTVGRSTGLETEITSGVAENEEVVVHPSDKVRNGVRIAPR